MFTYPGNVQMPSPMQRVVLIPHAFGGSYPTQDVGAGTLALFTGEYQLSESDVSVPGTGGNLTVGRTHGTLTGDLAGPAGVFGPGWTADFAGEGTGAAGYVVTDNTALDGTIILTSPDGESDVYAHSTGTKASLKTGTYKGVGETALNLDSMKLVTGGGTGISHTLTLTELDGTITEFRRTTAGVWSTHKTVEPEDNSTVQFIRDSNGADHLGARPCPGQGDLHGRNPEQGLPGAQVHLHHHQRRRPSRRCNTGRGIPSPAPTANPPRPPWPPSTS
ncbi:MAG: hypothetical protein R2703_15395 [Micropruina glycogenica]